MPRLTKRLKMMVTATLRENLEPPMLKKNDDSLLMFSGKLRAVLKMYFIVSCQIDAENKQPFCPLS